MEALGPFDSDHTVLIDVVGLWGTTAASASRAIRWNQVRSIGYNIVAVCAAAAGLINPLIAAILMPASSAMVIWGASRVEASMERVKA